MPTCIRYFETRLRGGQLIDVLILKSTFEIKKRASIESGSSIEARGQLDSRVGNVTSILCGSQVPRENLEQ